MNTHAQNRLARNPLRAGGVSIRCTPVRGTHRISRRQCTKVRLPTVWPKAAFFGLYPTQYRGVRALSVMESKEGRPGGFCVREGEEKDLRETAEVLIEAFNTFNASIGQCGAFILDDPEAVLPSMTDLHSHPMKRLAVAVSLDEEGREEEVIGMAGIRLADPVVSVQVVAVSTPKSRGGVGRSVLSFALDLAEKERGGECLTSLTQDTPNAAAFALYASLGFEVVEMLTCFEGYVPEEMAEEAIGTVEKEGTCFRKMEEGDVPKCNELFMRVIGHSRLHNIQSGLGSTERQPAIVGVRSTAAGGEEEEVVSYTTSLSMYGHSVAADEQHFRSLVSFASKLAKSEGRKGVFFQCMSRVNPAIVRWALKAGLQIKGQCAWMVKGGKMPVNPELVYAPGLDY